MLVRELQERGLWDDRMIADIKRAEGSVQDIERIPADQREVLVMKEFEGLKFREIAEILGCPESTVKSRMYYGLSGVRTVLEEAGIRKP